jgi:hypothetical protein
MMTYFHISYNIKAIGGDLGFGESYIKCSAPFFNRTEFIENTKAKDPQIDNLVIICITKMNKEEFELFTE